MLSTNSAEQIINISDMVHGGGLREERVMFKSMSELREKNKEIGHCFFDHDTMKFWNSKIETSLYRGTFFITSEKGNGAKDVRKYTIRQAQPNGAVVTVGRGREYRDLDSAKDAVKGLIKSLKILKPLKKAQVKKKVQKKAR